jgi:TetR/AcrR family transcriptional regulator, transcriptional repressor for nem operon
MVYEGAVARAREFDIEVALEQAMELFRERGFEGSSTRELAQRMGIGAGSFYAAFGSKERLYERALARHRDEMSATVERALNSGRPVPEILRRLVEMAFSEAPAHAWGPGCLLLRAASERALHTPAADRLLRDATTAVEDGLAATVRAGQARGEVGRERDPVELARFLAATMQGLRVMSLMGRPPAELHGTAGVAMACLG